MYIRKPIKVNSVFGKSTKFIGNEVFRLHNISNERLIVCLFRHTLMMCFLFFA